MSGKSILLILLAVILCAALVLHFMPMDAETTPNQIIPRESTAPSSGTENGPAQPGEGPQGLPTPTV